MAFWVPNVGVATFSAKFAVYRAASTPYFYKEEGTKQRGARRLDGKLLAQVLYALLARPPDHEAWFIEVMMNSLMGARSPR